MMGSELEARLKAVLLNGGATRRLFQLRQRRPELDQIAVAIKDAGDELLRWLRTLDLPIENDAA